MKYDRSKLRKLWRSIEEGKTVEDGWDAGKAFEYLVVRAFQIEGADVRWPYDIEIGGSVEELL